MIRNKIKILALACIVLAVIGTGNVFAYSWGSQDSSQIVGSNQFNSVYTVTGTPSATPGTYLSWQNYVANGFSGSVFYPTIFWNDPFGWWNSDPSQSTLVAGQSNYFSYMPESYPTEGSGKIPLTVQHRYGYQPNQNTFRQSFTQYFTE